MRSRLFVLAVSVVLVAVSAPTHAQAVPSVIAMPISSPNADAWLRTQFAACEANDADACARAAFSYRLGRSGVDRDPLTALQLYARSVSLARSRETLLALYEIVRSDHPTLSPVTRSALQRVCDAGGAYGCAAIALSDLERSDERASMADALDRLTAACGSSAVQVCYDLGAETGFLRARYPWYFASAR